MPRVVGIDIPKNKKLFISLTYIFGIGRAASHEIMLKCGFSEDMKAEDLGTEDIVKLNAVIQSDYVVEGEKRREIQGNIKRLMSIGSYRGHRHRMRMPVRGQKTRCNARTRKGKKQSVAGKKRS
ncbi:MAG: 30S ribosomal protein S13 [Chlamydiota bacterium]|nr:30S ribosomal protein S13 [Chlamydiota bacterium]